LICKLVNNIRDIPKSHFKSFKEIILILTKLHTDVFIIFAKSMVACRSMNIAQQQQTSEYYNMPLLPRLYSLLSLMVEVKKKKNGADFSATLYNLFAV